jgi:hypothetical protein
MILDVPNNTVHRVRLPDDHRATCYSAGENMLFLLHDDGRCSLMNIFSSMMTPLPELAALLEARGLENPRIIKVVMSSAPSLVAVLFRSSSSWKGFIAFTSYRPAGETNWCQLLKLYRYINIICDIAIFQGKIYAVTRDSRLLAVQFNNDEQTPRFRRLLRRILGGPPPHTEFHGTYTVRPYLVESNGKLLMVRRFVRWLSKSEGRTLFSVVEADLSRGQWNKVDGLEGQTLFVNIGCSKSVPAAAGDGAGEDCIYFLDECNVSRLHEGGLWDSGAYNMGDRTITRLLPDEPATPLASNSPLACPAWVFPVEV